MNKKSFKSNYNDYMKNIKPSKDLIEKTIKMAHQEENLQHFKEKKSLNVWCNLNFKKYSALAFTLVFAVFAVKLWRDISLESVPSKPKETITENSITTEYSIESDVTTIIQTDTFNSTYSNENFNTISSDNYSNTVAVSQSDDFNNIVTTIVDDTTVPIDNTNMNDTSIHYTTTNKDNLNTSNTTIVCEDTPDNTSTTITTKDIPDTTYTTITTEEATNTTHTTVTTQVPNTTYTTVTTKEATNTIHTTGTMPEETKEETTENNYTTTIALEPSDSIVQPPSTTSNDSCNGDINVSEGEGDVDVSVSDDINDITIPESTSFIEQTMPVTTTDIPAFDNNQYVAFRVTLYNYINGLYYNNSIYINKIKEHFSFGDSIVHIQSIGKTIDNDCDCIIVLENSSLSLDSIKKEFNGEYSSIEVEDYFQELYGINSLDFNNNGISITDDFEDRLTLLEILYIDD